LAQVFFSGLQYRFAMAQQFSLDEVAKHNTPDDLWIVVDGFVYDVSKFKKLHPGGAGVLKEVAGADATQQFFAYHRGDVLKKYSKLLKGTVVGVDAGATSRTSDRALLTQVPYSEASAFLGWHSPYYNETHRAMRANLRRIVQESIQPEADESENSGDAPSEEVYKAMGESGLLAARIGKDCMQFLVSIPEIQMETRLGVPVERFDHFHELIAHEEMGRLGTPGFNDGCGAGFCIGLPPVLHFAPPHIRDKVLPEVLRGEKRICLAISEPSAGSDVAGMLTKAQKSADGKHFIVSGVKKWITNGMHADYFVTAVRTGAEGHSGISMLFIARDMGVETKPIKTAYSACAGTALVIFDEVKVPVENLMGPGNKGKEGAGFFCVMANFNHERWFIVAQAVSAMRLVLDECFRWANQRKAFGKSLMTQPVIRFKLARMAGALEAVHNMLENVTHQMDVMPYQEQSAKLGGPIALLKFQATRVGTLIADEAAQIFGGRAITRTGMGSKVEGYLRTFKYSSILGGSEEVLADLAIRQQLRSPESVAPKL